MAATDFDRPNLTPLQAIRKTCLQCMGGAYSDVRDCSAGPEAALPKGAYSCPLWPYRMGNKPWEKRPKKKGKGVVKGGGLFTDGKGKDE